MKKYDFTLAKKIINKLVELDVLQEASLGMHEDWFWTANTIWEDGEWKQELISTEKADLLNNEYEEKRNKGELPLLLDGEFEEISTSDGKQLKLPKFNPDVEKYKVGQVGGLYGSSWATPVLQVTLKDGSQKTFNCYHGEEHSTDDAKKMLDMIAQINGGVMTGKINEERLIIQPEDFNENE